MDVDTKLLTATRAQARSQHGEAGNEFNISGIANVLLLNPSILTPQENSLFEAHFVSTCSEFVAGTNPGSSQGQPDAKNYVYVPATDVHAKNCRHPRPNVSFPANPVMGRNLLTPWACGRQGLRGNPAQSLCLCCFSSLRS